MPENELDKSFNFQFSESMVGSDVNIVTQDGKTIKPSLVPDAINTVQKALFDALLSSTLNIKTKGELQKIVHTSLMRLRQNYLDLDAYTKTDANFSKFPEDIAATFREAAYAMQQHGINYQDVIEIINIILSKSKTIMKDKDGKPELDNLGNVIYYTVSDLFVNYIIKNQMARSFGIKKPTLQNEGGTEKENQDSMDAAVIVAESRKVESFSDNTWSIATFTSATNRLKALLGSIPMHTIRYHKSWKTSLQLASPTRDALIAAVRHPKQKNPTRVTLTVNEKWGPVTRSRAIAVKPIVPNQQGVLITERIKLYQDSDREYGRAELAGKGSDYLVRILRKYQDSDFEAMKELLVFEKLIDANATSYTGPEIMLYEVIEKYNKEPVTLNKVYNKFGTYKFANYKTLFNRLEALFVNKQGLVWEEAEAIMKNSTDPTVRAVAERLRINREDEKGRRNEPDVSLRNNFLTIIQQEWNNLL